MSTRIRRPPPRVRPRPALPRFLQRPWQIVAATVLGCFRYRATGLAAEAAFFALLSVPPLVFGLAGSIGFVAHQIDPRVINDFRDTTLTLAATVLTPSTVSSVLGPTLGDVLAGGRADVISIGFVLALWSGSRALNVFLDAISILYGYQGHRNFIQARLLSFGLYIVFLVVAAILIPLALAGPHVVDSLLPDQLAWLGSLYWPILLCGSVFFLATLYRVSIPRGHRIRSGLPGGAVALGIWVAGSAVLRYALAWSTNGPSVYGPLAAPIALLLWLYVMALAVLIGAAFNAAVARVANDRPHRNPST